MRGRSFTTEKIKNPYNKGFKMTRRTSAPHILNRR
jgi:hypothetical protein